MSKDFFRLYHGFFGLLNLVALVVALALSLAVIVEYFSYFTVLSNIIITIVFLYFAFANPKKVWKHKLINTIYGPAVLYMTITGIVYWTILHGGKSLTTSTEWITLVLHGLMPIAVVVGWLLYPPHKKLAYKSALKWLVFPLLFVFYTLLRGPSANWYPYPFLNPATAGGYQGVFLYVLGILLGSYILALLLIKISRSRKKALDR